MTDKQIIIDGVDVSGCKYVNTQHPKLDWSNCGHICKDTECKYKRLWWKKQYIRKEQECVELKKQYNCYACGTCNGKEDYINLERHHIGLRKSFDELHKQLDQLKADREAALKQLEFVRTLNTVKEAEIRKLSKTLTEIKEMLQAIKETNNIYPLQNNLGKILQKISEVE